MPPIKKFWTAWPISTRRELSAYPIKAPRCGAFLFVIRQLDCVLSGLRC
jgi:hypothetical protein